MNTYRILKFLAFKACLKALFMRKGASPSRLRRRLCTTRWVWGCRSSSVQRPLLPTRWSTTWTREALMDSDLKGGEPITVKEAALYYAMGMGMPIVVGTASAIADKMEYYMDEGGADGFMLVATYTPGCFEEFVDWVVPELQRRGD